MSYSTLPRLTVMLALFLLASLSLLAWQQGGEVGRGADGASARQAVAPEQVTPTVTRTLAAATTTATRTPTAAGTPTPTGTRLPGTVTPDLPPRLYLPLLERRLYRPAYSGRLIWADNRLGNWDIWISDADGIRALTQDWNTSDELDPVLSQDGRYIYFATNRDGDRSRVEDRQFEIYRMNVDGSGRTRLTETQGFTSVNPAISPNGQSIAFTSDAGTFNSLDIYVIRAFQPGDAAINVTDAARLTWPDAPPTLRPSPTVPSPTPSPTTTPRVDPTSTPTATLSVYDNYFRQSTSRQPSWSPDGAKIAFVSNRQSGNQGCGQEEIYVMQADGRNQQRVTCSRGQNLWPRWSPDGNRLAFISNRDGNWELYTIRVDGSDERRLTRNQAVDTQPTWVRNTLDLAFVGICRDPSDNSYRYGICLLRDTASPDPRLVIAAQTDVYAPWWGQ